MELIKRPRRLRTSEAMRSLVRETDITVKDLIYPIFITEGSGVRKEIQSMPGISQLSIDNFLMELEEIQSLGIPGVLLFGIPDVKDEVGSQAYDDNGIIQRALREAKKQFPKLLLIADVCLCEYTNHGHCGLIENEKVMNDCSLELIAKSALSYAKAGADIVAPSDMMDGRVRAIRKALDKNGFTDMVIMSYSAKYSSSFYGPFRDAAKSKPVFGDRKTYQMDYSNINEGLREVELDIEEGADIVMIKPALAYLDVIGRVSREFDIPIAAYNVSGEYSMIKAAAEKGWIDEKGAVFECITGIKRAGAKIIITYFAKQLAKWIKEGR